MFFRSFGFKKFKWRERGDLGEQWRESDAFGRMDWASTLFYEMENSFFFFSLYFMGFASAPFTNFG